jgi:hypothetical protein
MAWRRLAHSSPLDRVVGSLSIRGNDIYRNDVHTGGKDLTHGSNDQGFPTIRR